MPPNSIEKKSLACAGAAAHPDATTAAARTAPRTIDLFAGVTMTHSKVAIRKWLTLKRHRTGQ
jgi:hypothetical protein